MNATPSDRRLSSIEDLEALSFDERGLLPVVAQHAGTGEVLMLAWANRDALMRSLESGELTFWSRSRAALWRKGESSGNVLRVVSLHGDCDGDAVLAVVEPAGPACHTGERSCFGVGATSVDALDELWEVLEARAGEPSPESYTTRLLENENLRIKKLGEETAELVVALTRGEREEVRSETADLIYHLLVALLGAGVSLAEVRAELASRRRQGR